MFSKISPKTSEPFKPAKEKLVPENFEKSDWAEIILKMQSEDDLSRLNLESHCNDKAIKLKYNQYALKFHPDKNPNFSEEAKTVFILVSESKDRLLALPQNQRIHIVKSYFHSSQDKFAQEVNEQKASIFAKMMHEQQEKINKFRANFENEKQQKKAELQAKQQKIEEEQKNADEAFENEKKLRLNELKASELAIKVEHEKKLREMEAAHLKKMKSLHEKNPIKDLSGSAEIALKRPTFTVQNAEEKIHTLILKYKELIERKAVFSEERFLKSINMTFAQMENDCQKQDIDFVYYMMKLQHFFQENQHIVTVNLNNLEQAIQKYLSKFK